MRALVLATLLGGCVLQPTATDDCDSARRIFAHCGVLLPLLETTTCSGFTKAVAKCVERTHGDCDALAALSSSLDECANEIDDELPPVGDVPLPSSPDGGADLAQRVDAGSSDLGLDLASASDLAGAWVGYVFSESVDAGNQHQHQTPELAPGRYQFAISGTGNADLYVRVGLAPTTNLFDCAPRLPGSDETCTVELSTAARIFAVVRGVTGTSTYTLTGSQVP